MKTLPGKILDTVRIVVLGLLIVFSATAVQAYLLLANTKILPGLPWSLLLLILYMILWLGFFQGNMIATGSAFRKKCFRDVIPEREIMKWGLLTGSFFGAAILCSFFLLLKSFVIPLTLLPFNGVPWYMKFIYLLMVTAVAGVSEEVGFRGYIQRPLERLYGSKVAVIITSLLFTLAHLGHAEFNYMLTVYFCFSLVLGTIAYHSDSLLPSIIIHFVFDFWIFTTFWLIGKDNLTQQISETGFTELHFLYVAIMITGVVNGRIALRRLKSLRLTGTSLTMTKPDAMQTK